MIRRVLAALLCTAAVAAGGWIAPSSAHADTYELSVKEGETLKKTFPPLGAADPSGSFTAPADCPGAPGHVCDLLTISIGEPADPNDYVIRIRLTFQADQLANGVEQSDDIDIYLWDNPPADHDADKEGGDEAPDEIMHSAGTSTTESVGIDSLPGRKYDLVVYHSIGRNTGYNVEIRYFPGGGVRPDESLEPEFSPKLPSEGGSKGSVARPTGNPFAAVGSPVGGLGSELAIVGGDSGFLDSSLPGVGGPSSFDKANALAGAFGRQAEVIRPPRPVKDLTVALWMTITPAALLAAGAFVMLRRRPAALLIH